jgi:tetratricopeptide (TPR) repeat protein
MRRALVLAWLAAAAGCLFNAGAAQQSLVQGDMLLLAKDYGGAVSQFDRALAANPSLYEGYLHRGIAYRRLGDYDRARADFDKAVEVVPERSRAFAERARTKLEQLIAQANGDRGQFAEAFGPADPLGLNADLDRAAFLEPVDGDGSTYLLRGAVRLMQQRDGEAQHDFDRFLRLRPTAKAGVEDAVAKWKKDSPVLDLSVLDELSRVRPAKG